MVRLVALLAFASGCTLIVQNEIDSCPDLPFTDGSPNGGQHFHGGVAAPSFRGPAFPPAGQDIGGYGATLTFLSGGFVQQVGGLAGDEVFRRAQNFGATTASSAPGHNGPGGFGCAEVVAATYDSLHDRTSLQLLASGCGNDEAFDGGTFTGAPISLSPALAWAPAADGGGMIGSVLGAQGQSCPEVFPASCFPPTGGIVSGNGARRIDSLSDQTRGTAWIVATEGGDTRLYSGNFVGSAAVASWSGPISAVAPDVGIVMRIDSGQLAAQLFDTSGAARGGEARTPLNDSGAHGLEIARLGTSAVLRLAWIGGDGKARAAAYDATVAAAQQLGPVSTVCGSTGATFAAPTSTTTVAVMVGDSLYLRHVQ